MAIQRAYTGTSGTLTAHYGYNEGKGKQKLSHFAYTTPEKTTQVALAKVWVNGIPVQHLKGFKSSIMPEQGQLVCEGDQYILELKEFSYESLSLHIQLVGHTIDLVVPTALKGIGLKKMIAKELEHKELSTLVVEYGGYAIDASLTLEDSGFTQATQLKAFLRPTEENQEPQGKITSWGQESFGNTIMFVVPEPENTKLVAFAEEGPSWRIVTKGLNLEGKCATTSCNAFNEKVVVKLGMGTFEVVEQNAEATCPQCNGNFKEDITNCYFWDCIYEFKGVLDDRTKFSLENQTAPKNGGYITFEKVVNGENKVKAWKYLKITAKPS